MIQSRKKKLWQWAVRGLGGLFLAAILLLELHLEFSVHVGWYLGFLGAILALYVWAAVLQLQQFVEDYRAVSEALRVQLVWWDAGLIGRDYCVDSYYLVGTTGSLATVRAAARLLIMAAELECPPPEPVQGAADTWIRDQIKFFDGNIYKRQTKVLWSEDLTWFCFIGSAGMATMLFDKAAQPFAAIGDWLASHWGVYLIATLGLLIAARIRSLGDEQEGGALLARTLVVLAGLIAFGWGVLSGALFSALGEAQHDRALFADVHGDVGHQLVAVAAVVIASFAGALRFFAERLGWEPELHSYREALDTFTRAGDALAGPGGAAAAKEEREKIIFDLGRFALAENESWIRAHRVRPIEPMH
jgi:hypothetical protein